MEEALAIPDWEDDGFGASPVEHSSKGTERIMRCYSDHPFEDRYWNRHGAARYGNCFWVFRAGADGGPIGNSTLDRGTLDVDLLESNLNAALWENTFQKVGVFLVREGIKYRIGTIGQATRGTQKNLVLPGVAEGDRLMHVSSKDFTCPAKALLQVKLCIPPDVEDVGAYLRKSLTFVAGYAVRGRHRYMGGRSTAWN